MKNKKHTTAQRLSKLENVVSQLWVANKMIQDELAIIQEHLKIGKFKDEEE